MIRIQRHLCQAPRMLCSLSRGCCPPRSWNWTTSQNSNKLSKKKWWLMTIFSIYQVKRILMHHLFWAGLYSFIPFLARFFSLGSWRFKRRPRNCHYITPANIMNIMVDKLDDFGIRYALNQIETFSPAHIL